MKLVSPSPSFGTKGSHPAWMLGLVGFSYPDWQGTFYPRGLPSTARLAYAASRFGAVEVNTTFYALPTQRTLDRWRDETPPGFRLCLKMLSSVTHGATLGKELRLSAPPTGHLLLDSTREQTDRFFEAAQRLGPKLGPVLVQFPPTFTSRRFAELGTFLGFLPRSVRVALELRHDSWHTPHTAALLREHNIAWVAADRAPKREAAAAPAQDRVGARPQIVPTSDFLYIRWLGRHNQFQNRRQEHFDPTPRLAWWARSLREVLRENPRLRNVYAFFDNDFAGHSPTTANRFAALIGIDRLVPQGADPEGPTLFGDLDPRARRGVPLPTPPFA